MISRLQQNSSPGQFRALPALPRRPNYAALTGWLLIGGLTAVFLLWLFYRWWSQPAWLANLPVVLSEFISLIETASAFTLGFLWLALGLRRWLHHRSPPAQTPLLSIEQLYELNPKAFEKYVAALFRQRGYRVVWRGGSGDHGVDLELFHPEGRRAVVQCKRYRNTVGEEIVRELYGTLIHEHAHHGFLVTTADISDAARQWAQYKPITLIDGAKLIEIVGRLNNNQA